MVITAANQASRLVSGGLRPLDPVHDLRDVARLIDRAFGSDMDDRGRAALRELRWMARLSPLVWWLSHADPEFRDAFRGYVWQAPEADRNAQQVVGNVNLNRTPGNRQRYIICNVVVAEEFRNRGIGRQLTQAAIDQANDLGAQGILLQVYRDNRPAMHLYLDLGFHEVTGETEFASETVPPVAVVDAFGYTVRPWLSGDGQKVHDMAQRAVPQALQWIRPLRFQDYWSDPLSRFLERVGSLLAGRRTYRLVALDGSDPVASVSVTVDFRQRSHHLSLLVHPHHRGQVEAALLSRALHILAAIPPRPIHASLYLEDQSAIRLLQSYGFQERRTLLTMRRDLR